MAVLGGVVLVFLVLMTCWSVIGRELNSFFKGEFATQTFPALAQWISGLGVGPVSGDVELVEAGVAFAIFAFFPICQLGNGHAKVDIFTSGLPRRVRAGMQALTDMIFAVALILIAWRLSAGLAEKQQYSETTFMLQFPIWWAYAASLVAASIAAATAIFVAFARLTELVTGHDRLADQSEFDL